VKEEDGRRSFGLALLGVGVGLVSVAEAANGHSWWRIVAVEGAIALVVVGIAVLGTALNASYKDRQATGGKPPTPRRRISIIVSVLASDRSRPESGAICLS